mgnify:CR=1 FL=1
MKNRIILFVIVLLGCVTALKAQNREYSAEIDTNYILIGDQIHFRMKVKAEPGVITDEPGGNEQKDLQGHFKQKCDLIRPEPFFLLQGRKTEVGQRAKGERQRTGHQRRRAKHLHPHDNSGKDHPSCQRKRRERRAQALPIEDLQREKKEIRGHPGAFGHIKHLRKSEAKRS